jgi:hypothetical protein
MTTVRMLTPKLAPPLKLKRHAVSIGATGLVQRFIKIRRYFFVVGKKDSYALLISLTIVIVVPKIGL